MQAYPHGGSIEAAKLRHGDPLECVWSSMETASSSSYDYDIMNEIVSRYDSCTFEFDVRGPAARVCPAVEKAPWQMMGQALR